MSIASELNNLEGNIEDSYDAVNDMGGIVPAQKNMDNLDQAIRTIPQNTGTTYTAGTGIDITSDVISVDNTTVPYFTDLATVATTGDYGDLLNTPTIPAAQVNSDWNANSGVAQILNKPSLATVATSGLYSDLTGTPSLATVATSGDYGDLLNKPTIPTVNDATLTIQHNGTNVQTFTANQSTNATANIETIWADDIEATTPVPAVETDMIADGAVTSAKIADGAIATGDIADGAVTSAKMAADGYRHTQPSGLTDANNLTDTGLYYLTEIWQNAPDPGSQIYQAIVIMAGGAGHRYGHQIFINLWSNATYIRGCYDGAWGAWQQFTVS